MNLEGHPPSCPKNLALAIVISQLGDQDLIACPFIYDAMLGVNAA